MSTDSTHSHGVTECHCIVALKQVGGIAGIAGIALTKAFDSLSPIRQEYAVSSSWSPIHFNIALSDPDPWLDRLLL